MPLPPPWKHSIQPLLHGIAIALVFVAMLEEKNIPPILYVLALAVGLIVRRKRPNGVAKRFFYASAILVWVTVWLPYNINIRHGDHTSIKILPAVYDLGYRQEIRDMESQGLVENRDYIVVGHSMPTFPPIKYSVVIIFGTENGPKKEK